MKETLEGSNYRAAQRWINHHRNQMVDIDDYSDFQGFEEIDNLCRNGDVATAVDMIELIANITNDEYILENLGAGPIEDILVSRGWEATPLLKIACERTKKLRTALSFAWTEGIPPDLRAQVEKILL